METLELNTIKKEIIVAAAQQTAFEVFVNQIGRWWPTSGHNEGCPMVRVGLEPKSGGRWTGYTSDGTERNLGKVLIYDPYALLTLDWQTSADFKFDPNLHTEVRVEFVAQGQQTTLVSLTHKNVHLLGGPQNSVDVSEGWGDVMAVYRQFLSSFNTLIVVGASPQEAEKRISQISGWWAKNFQGSAAKLHDRFTVRFGDTFVSFELINLIPGDTVVWEVEDCYLHWQKDKTEWNGTRVVWELIPEGEGTKIVMTHIGLTPEAECYESCRTGWTEHINESLLNFILAGKGEPQ
jgi:hypothetical protein